MIINLILNKIMFNLPKNTEMKQQLPKSKIFEKLDLTSKEKAIDDNSISTLYIVNNISKKKISQLLAGDEIKSIWFILANFNKEEDIENAITLIFKSICKIIFILKYINKFSLSCFYEKIIISD